jgi:hypothetical protein
VRKPIAAAWQDMANMARKRAKKVAVDLILDSCGSG